MTDLNRQEELTTADLAGRRTAGKADVQAATRNAEYHEEYVATDPLRPRLVQSDVANTDFHGEPVDQANGTPEVNRSRDWETTRPVTDASLVNNASHGMASETLFSDSVIGDLRTRWSDVQAAFVDEPRRSVEQADQLVATVMQRLAEGFANERASLERQWDSGDNVSTEELRVALQRYRAFFGRLLNAA